MRTVNVTHLPITSIVHADDGKSTKLMYVASFEDLVAYNCKDFNDCAPINLDYGIKCLESRWGYVFIGLCRGWFARCTVNVSSLLH